MLVYSFYVVYYHVFILNNGMYFFLLNGSNQTTGGQLWWPTFVFGMFLLTYSTVGGWILLHLQGAHPLTPSLPPSLVTCAVRCAAPVLTAAAAEDMAICGCAGLIPCKVVRGGLVIFGGGGSAARMPANWRNSLYGSELTASGAILGRVREVRQRVRGSCAGCTLQQKALYLSPSSFFHTKWRWNRFRWTKEMYSLLNV